MPEIEKSCKTCINELLKKTEAPCLYCNLASKEYRGGDGIYWISDLNKDHQKEQTNKPEIIYEEKRNRIMFKAFSNNAEAVDFNYDKVIRDVEQLALTEGRKQQKETEKIVREMIKLVEDFEYIQYEEDIGLVVPYINQTDLLTQLKRLSETKNR